MKIPIRVIFTIIIVMAIMIFDKGCVCVHNTYG